LWIKSKVPFLTDILIFQLAWTSGWIELSLNDEELESTVGGVYILPPERQELFVHVLCDMSVMSRALIRSTLSLARQCGVWSWEVLAASTLRKKRLLMLQHINVIITITKHDRGMWKMNTQYFYCRVTENKPKILCDLLNITS